MMKMWKCRSGALAVIGAAALAVSSLGAAYGGPCTGRAFARSTPGNAESGTPGNAVPQEKPGAHNLATPANLLMMKKEAGDLWEDWGGSQNFPGDGTEEKPYQITGLSHLMGLSQAVAEGNSFAGVYFELTSDIDLGGLQRNGGNWNPIGWYQTRDQMGEGLPSGFSGVFDGCGNRIYGLQILQGQDSLRELGLFGVIDGGEVKHLTVEADKLCGDENVGILAGIICGDSVIYDVTVSGYASSELEDGVKHSKDDCGNVGGIAGSVNGNGGAGNDGMVVIENSTAEGVILRNQDPEGYVGGIAGAVQNAILADSTVYTQNGASDRIQGKGFTGGIAGVMKEAKIYNSYVDGTVGGNGSRAAGGIVGKYESGELILARFAGDISRTNNGTASREGTFVGTRDSRDTFTFGTERGDHLAYLFANTAAKAKQVFGSRIDGDNSYRESAHVGYWTDRETRYVLLDGTVEKPGKERYFYEELEDGVRFLITQKLEQDFTQEGEAAEPAFRLDHFAPGYQGEPVSGYLLSVPRIDVKNANGTYDTDVAVLTALPGGSNTYYRTIDKDHSGAVAPGVAVSVVTAPKNTEKDRYQMAAMEGEPGGVRPPVYINDRGKETPMAYVSGGTYTFLMPKRDTQINAEYVKTTTSISMWPEEMVLSVTQTRSGDRKAPQILTEVRNEQGILMARYINGQMETEAQPVRIHGEHNSFGDAVGKALQWSVDDGELLTLLCPDGYTTEDARVMPNLSGSFIREIIRREETAQADSGYQEAIKPTVYEKKGVVTAVSDPAESVDHQPVYGNCRITVTFQILDETTRRVEGLSLNYGTAAFTVTRTLTGDRLHPAETITCTEPVILSASLYPVQPFEKGVTWKDDDSGKTLFLEPGGQHEQDCRLRVRFDPKGQANPAWLQNVINRDREQRKKEPYKRLQSSAVHKERVTATAEDQTHGLVSASCDVTVRFVTEDKTEIMTEQIQLEKKEAVFDLQVKKTGKSQAPVMSYEGFEPIKLEYRMSPDLPQEEIYGPFDRKVTWRVSDEELLTVDEEGRVTPKKDAGWIREAMSRYPYEGETEAYVYAEAKSGASARALIKLRLKGTVQTTGGSGSSSGGSSSGGGSAAGSVGITPHGSRKQTWAPAGSVVGTWVQTSDGLWSFHAGGRSYCQEWAYIHNPYADVKAGEPGAGWFRFDESGHMVTGWFTDADGNQYYLDPGPGNTKGCMVTGWHWIPGADGKEYCYYFQEQKNGTEGALFCDGVTPDGYQTDKQGAWTVGGIVQVR